MSLEDDAIVWIKNPIYTDIFYIAGYVRQNV